MNLNLTEFIQELLYLKKKDESYVINHDEYRSIGTHWTALYVNGNNRRESYNAIYFDSVGVKYIPKEIK